MRYYNRSALQHILKNKQIVLSSIILGLAAVFIFSLEDQLRAQAPVIRQLAESEDFVNKAQENEIQPAETSLESYTRTDAIMYEQSMGEKVACGSSYTSAVPVAYGDLLSKKIKAPILMYHYIEVPGTTTLPWLYESPAIFEAQLKTLANNCYRSIFVSDVAKAIDSDELLPAKSIALTFDDGYEDMYTQAYPLLKKYGMKGTMYIIVNALDKPGYLTKAQAKEMAESGYVEIASHTFNHINLRQASQAAANYEIAGSKGALEKIIGQPVTDFAYPYGFFNLRDEEICRQTGYLTCASTYPGQVQTFDKRYSLYRLRPGYRVGPALVNWLELAGPKR